MMKDGGSITIKEVAQLAGVSIATVSRVLNHHASVTADTEQRVREAMLELGYNRNEVARSLKVRHTRTIGIIAPELSNTFFMEVVETMDCILTPHGYTMIICSSNDSVQEEQRKLQVLIERNVDALVVIPASDEGGHFLTKALAGIPLVLVDRKIPGLHVDTVLTDNRYGVRQLVTALVHEGFSRIGFIGGDMHIPTANERFHGFLEALRDHHLEPEKDFVLMDGAMNQYSGRALMEEALSRPNHPDAFLLANDSLHLGATTYVMECVSPEVRSKLVFASFDYLHYAPLLRFCHYAAAQPMEKIGKAVAALVLKRLEHDWSSYPEEVVLRPEIKVMSANGGIPFMISRPESVGPNM